MATLGWVQNVTSQVGVEQNQELLISFNKLCFQSRLMMIASANTAALNEARTCALARRGRVRQGGATATVGVPLCAKKMENGFFMERSASDVETALRLITQYLHA